MGASGSKQLVQAAEDGNVLSLKELLGKGVPVDSKDDAGVSALGHAIIGGHLDIVQELIRSNASINTMNFLHGAVEGGHYTMCFLHGAVEGGHLAIVKELVRARASIDMTSGDMGQDALHRAARVGHLEIVQELLRSSASVDTKDSFGNTLLHSACWQHRPEVIRELIRSQASVSKERDIGATVLQLGVYGGHLDVVQELIRSQATVNGNAFALRRTALHMAAGMGHLEIVKELIRSQANVFKKMMGGRDALDMAAEAFHTDVVQVLEKTKEDASFTRPLQVNAVKEGATITVTCTDMNGAALATFALDEEAKFHALLDLIRDRAPLPAGAWTLVSPDGDVLNETQPYTGVDELFFGAI